MPYSRNALPSDVLISAGSANDPCLTAFEKDPLERFLRENPTSQYFQKSEDESIPTQLHFVFVAYDNAGQILNRHRGELPCPEHCLPGVPLIEFNKFAPSDIHQVLNSSPNVTHLCLHKCTTAQGQSTYMIYPHDGSGPLRNLIALVSIQ